MSGIPSHWTLEASNNLSATARDAVRTAHEESR